MENEYSPVKAFADISRDFRDAIKDTHHYSSGLFLYVTLPGLRKPLSEKYNKAKGNRTLGKFILEGMEEFVKENPNSFSDNEVSPTIKQYDKNFSFKEYVSKYKDADKDVANVLSDIKVLKENILEKDLKAVGKEINAMEIMLNQIKDGFVIPPQPIEEYVRDIERKKS